MLAAVDWHVVWQRLFHPDHVFFRAMYTTVYIAVIAQVMGVLLGLVAALMRSSRLWPLRFLSGLYVLIFRGTPLLVQIFFIYYGANLLLGFTLIPNSLDLGLFSLDGAVVAGILALGVNEGAYMREIIRAGIDSIDTGQMEAAKSLGMRYGLAMRRIILPQAARVIVPPLGNEFNNMLKTTSLVFTIGVYEMFADAEIHYSNTFLPVEYFLAVAFWYLVLTGVWGIVQAIIERRLSASERGDDLSFRERLAQAWAPAGAFVGR
jgi:polar amino acid transport system permease protein